MLTEPDPDRPVSELVAEAPPYTAPLPVALELVEPETEVPAVPVPIVDVVPVSILPDVLLVLVLLVDAHSAKKRKLAIRIASFCIVLLVRGRGLRSAKATPFLASSHVSPREEVSTWQAGSQ